MLVAVAEQHIQVVPVQVVQAAVVTVKHMGVHRQLVQVL
jgi:hypothetical protein